jgi:hypothetical protein
MLHIRQCKLCPLAGNCDHKKQLVEKLLPIKKLHFIHNCTKYKTLFKAGDRVEIELLNYSFDTIDGDYGQTISSFSWESAGFATGTIERMASGGNRWIIKLDTEVELTRSDTFTSKIEPEKFTHQSKPGNKIRKL